MTLSTASVQIDQVAKCGQETRIFENGPRFSMVNSIKLTGSHPKGTNPGPLNAAKR